MSIKLHAGNHLLALLAGLATLSPMTTSAGGGVQLGILTCTAVPGTHSYYVIHHTVDVDCTYSHVGGTESYRGSAGIGFGLDLNWRQTDNMAFTVIGGASDIDQSAYSLAGKYVGAQASVSLAVGADAAVLIGGGSKTISLQPIALGVNTGLGAALGIGYLSLRPATES